MLLMLMLWCGWTHAILTFKTASATVLYSGGNSSQPRLCATCTHPLLHEPDFACSNQASWNSGDSSFADPVPSGHSVVQMLFMVSGTFNCDQNPALSNITFKLNGAEIVTSYLPVVPQGCFCGNCDIVIPIQSRIFARSVDSYVYGGFNVLHASPSTVICLSRINITLFYVPCQ